MFTRFPVLRRNSPGVAGPSSPGAPAAADQAADSALLTRIANGEHAAYSVFVQRHLDRLLAFIERTLGSREEAEDLVQEAFLKVWTHAGRWRDQGYPVSTWLHQIALNLCRDHWRRQRGASVDLDEDLRCASAGPEQAAVSQDQAHHVRRALQALPERQRVAIVLNHFQGMSNPEVAAILDCSVEAVESLLGRARRTLRQSLLDHHPAREDSDERT